jgi:hypothetical protein
MINKGTDALNQEADAPIDRSKRGCDYPLIRAVLIRPWFFETGGRADGLIPHYLFGIRESKIQPMAGQKTNPSITGSEREREMCGLEKTEPYGSISF